MKKIFVLGLAILMSFSLVACGDKEDVPTEDNTSVEQPVPEVTVEDEIVLRGEFLPEYFELNTNDINKFLGTAIMNVRPEEYRINDIPVISSDSPNAGLIMSLMHLKEEYFENYAISTSQSNTRAYTVALLKAEYGYEEQIINSIGERISDLYVSVKNYPDQLYLLENAIIEQVGDYLFVIICDNSDKVFEELKKVMINTDLTTLEVVPYMTDEERAKIEEDAYNLENIEVEGEIDEVIVTPIEAPELIEGEELENIDLPVEDVSNE